MKVSQCHSQYKIDGCGNLEEFRKFKKNVQFTHQKQIEEFGNFDEFWTNQYKLEISSPDQIERIWTFLRIFTIPEKMLYFIPSAKIQKKIFGSFLSLRQNFSFPSSTKLQKLGNFDELLQIKKKGAIHLQYNISLINNTRNSVHYSTFFQ